MMTTITYLMLMKSEAHGRITAMTTTMTAFGMLPIQTMITMDYPIGSRIMMATPPQDNSTTTMTAYPTTLIQTMMAMASLTSLNRE